jgi:hypothetical protein
MGSRQMGRHWSTEEGRQVSTLRKIEGEQKKISEVRTTCKSHTDDKGQKASAVKRKRAAGNTGPKPKNVRTFASAGGYIGPAINSTYAGKKLNNPSYGKYYKGMI